MCAPVSIRPGYLAVLLGLPVYLYPTAATLTGIDTEAAEVRVYSNEFGYDPQTIPVDVGRPIKLVLDNSRGAIQHDLSLPELGVSLKAGAGQTADRRLVFTHPGRYLFRCSVPGHGEAGMTGVFLVTTGGTETPPAAPTEPPGEGKVDALPEGLSRPRQPSAAPPVGRAYAKTVHVALETRSVTGLIADGIGYRYWTYNGTVPGPMIRVRQGDTVELTLKNALDSPVTHSIDSHAVTGPGGGAPFTQTPPGRTSILRFKALKPGAYVYHCASPLIPHHIGNGMYGLMVVEPLRRWPRVDREFYVMQGDFYLTGDPARPGLHEGSLTKMLSEKPDYVVFNGSVGALSQDHALKARVGETVRIFFGVGGPNVTSSFHVIGEMFDRLYREAGTEYATNIQTTLVPAGGAAIADLKLDYPGRYILVDHSLARLQKGAVGLLEVEGRADPSILQAVPVMGGAAGHH
ncbi:copper-containing nitrite reductase [Candidatus Methylocalor cossyra]|uniref:Copper-containing nitrite reductase n=1 Tax=Candidatus Methylocalor cossyra TaxID=3108543 RepID=A0ABP1C467_9GAMM